MLEKKRKMNYLKILYLILKGFVISMRKPKKTNFGSEIIFAQEDWFTGSFLNINTDKTLEKQTAENDMIFYIDDGIAVFEINNSKYEFGFGKTILIKKGTTYSITAVTPLRIIKITKELLKDKDFSGGEKFVKNE